MNELANDRLRGMKSIAEFIGEDERRCYYLATTTCFPAFSSRETAGLGSSPSFVKVTSGLQGALLNQAGRVTNDDRKRTADKFRWLDQVGADHGLTPLCFRLAYAIVTFVNRATGDAWPTVRFF